ncbi:hypothetical protein IH824_15780, partial [candidate division KSB1 bacterium]|nr:hypothetical protein [candidate division KSB1 bacterium]
IKNDEQLKKAKETVRNLEQILEKARKVHSPSEYKAMSEPILLELQQRENEIIQCLSVTESQIAGFQ